MTVQVPVSVGELLDKLKADAKIEVLEAGISLDARPAALAKGRVSHRFTSVDLPLHGKRALTRSQQFQ